MNLRTPGPTPLPPGVREALSRDMVNHRGPEARDLMRRVTVGLKAVFQTENDVLVLTGSGTGGLEAAVVNLFSPGERILSVTIGVFGDRFAKIAERFGVEVLRLSFPLGTAADPKGIAARLEEDPSITSVLVTHNETSTAVTNDLEVIARVVKAAGRLLVVDAISSLGGIDLKTDAWGCDVVITGSQKAFMIPPGLAMISMSELAWRKSAEARLPRFYWDLAAARKSLQQKSSTPWTPALGLIFALDVALEMMAKEGLPAIFERHRRVAEFCRRGLKAAGWELFPEERWASNTVTAVRMPEGMEAKRVSTTLRDRDGIVVAGGQGELEGKILRVGHLGYVDVPDLEPVVEAFRKIRSEAG